MSQSTALVVIDMLNRYEHEDAEALRNSVRAIDAVGMEAHGALIGKLAHKLTGMLPDALACQAMQTVWIDRLSALHMAIELVQRGGTVSLSGVYGGAASHCR